MPAMSTKSREVIYGSQIRGAKIRAEGARKRCRGPVHEADRADAEAWSIQMEGYGGPAQPPNSRPMPQRRIRLARSRMPPLQDRASLPLDAIRRPRNTPIWKLEAALKCRSCKKGRYAPPVHMIKLTQEREITPYVWVHLDEER
jgi:hypothetical protein